MLNLMSKCVYIRTSIKKRAPYNQKQGDTLQYKKGMGMKANPKKANAEHIHS